MESSESAPAPAPANEAVAVNGTVAGHDVDNSINRLPHLQDLATQLQKCVANGETDAIKDILLSIEREKMSLAILKATKLGKIVNKLKKKITDPEIILLSRKLVANWRTIVPQNKSKSKHKKSKKSNIQNTNEVNHNGNTNTNTDINAVTNNTNQNPNQPQNVNNAQRDGVSADMPMTNNKESEHPFASNPSKHNENRNQSNNSGDSSDSHPVQRRQIDWRTGVSRRDKVIEKLIAVLKPDEDSEHFENHVRLSQNIEVKLDELYSHKTTEYLQRYRDINFNLKKNVELKVQALLLDSDLSVDRLCRMSTHEMAKSDLKKQRDRDQKWMLEDARNDLKAASNTTLTDQFKCGKCKKRKCKYSQAQTRSADEPMTIFISCMTCGNRWKVN